MKKSSSGILVTGIAVMAVTAILYFVLLDDFFLEVINSISLIGVLLAELITLGYFYSAGDSPRKVAGATVSAVMIPIALILSVVYIVGFPYAYGKYIALYVAFSLIVNAIAFSLFRFDSQRAAENITVQSSKSQILSMRKIVKCIMADPAAASYLKDLHEIEEKLHFTNDCVVAPQDEKIFTMLMELQSNISVPGYDAAPSLTALKQTIDMRTIMSSRTV